MKAFIDCTVQTKELLEKIIDSPALHGRWLNTLSFLENCGARKIAACEHPTLVKEEMLKHAAEEFRHAHYLKRQIARVWSHPIDTYALSSMLGGVATLHYLHSLDVKTCRYLKRAGLKPTAIKEFAYLLVTYAIELRAEEFYPLYDEALRKKGSKVTVKSILLEEKEHLREMREGLDALPSGWAHADVVCSFESTLCQQWLQAVGKSIS